MLLPELGNGADGVGAAGFPVDGDGHQGQVARRGGNHGGRDGETRILNQRGFEIADGCLHPGVAEVAVDDDFNGVHQAERELLFQDEERFPGLRALGECVNAVDPGVDVEVEDDGDDHGHGHDEETDDGHLGNDASGGFPETVLLRSIVAGPAPSEERNGKEVDLVAEQREHGGQQGQRGGQRHQHDDDGPDAQRLEESSRDNEHSTKGDHDGEAAEQNRAARGSSGPDDRFALLQAPLQLFPETGHDEQRIVDTHGQADHGDHQRYEENQVEHLADQGRDAQGDYD